MRHIVVFEEKKLHYWTYTLCRKLWTIWDIWFNQSFLWNNKSAIPLTNVLSKNSATLSVTRKN